MALSKMDVHSFRCGACGTEVTNLWLVSNVIDVMKAHAPVCPASTTGDCEAVATEEASS